MICVSLPKPGPFGWGVAAAEITQALQKLTRVEQISDDLGGRPHETPWPVLHACQGVNLMPIRPNLWSTTKNIGYSFVEDNILVKIYVLNAKRHYDHLFSGSTWGAQALIDAGIDKARVGVAIQGVSDYFLEDWPDLTLNANADDKFIVFSGGKAEHRKGQDLVIKAMGVFMQRHKDVYLSAAWNNVWASQFPEYGRIMYQAQQLPRKMLGPGFLSVSHEKMWDYYRNSDIGLFPNRCEAGTNLVLMEYMAAGKPVIATYATGHVDVLDPASDLNLVKNTPKSVRDQLDRTIAIWPEPDLDEIADKLELAYSRRGSKLREIGRENRERMRQWTWERCAREFLNVLAQT